MTSNMEVADRQFQVMDRTQDLPELLSYHVVIACPEEKEMGRKLSTVIKLALI